MFARTTGANSTSHHSAASHARKPTGYVFVVAKTQHHVQKQCLNHFTVTRLQGLPPVPPPTPPCKSCTTDLDCDEGEICEGGAGRRKLRFGNIHDGCCRIADEL